MHITEVEQICTLWTPSTLCNIQNCHSNSPPLQALEKFYGTKTMVTILHSTGPCTHIYIYILYMGLILSEKYHITSCWLANCISVGHSADCPHIMKNVQCRVLVLSVKQ